MRKPSKHATVAALCAVVRAGQQAPAPDLLVPLRTGGARLPLFLLPGAGGNLMYLHGLARHLAGDRPIFGLQAPGLDGGTAPVPEVETLASLYVAEIRRACPAGPCVLAGHSFGGRVALEVSQQLRLAGYPVALLAIFDTPAPFFTPAPAGAGWDEADWLARIVEEMEVLFGITLGLTAGSLRRLAPAAQVDTVLQRLRTRTDWAAAMEPQHLRGYLAVYKANMQARHVEYPSLARMPLALFKAADDAEAVDAPPPGLTALLDGAAWGWDAVAQGTPHVATVPGSHLTMFAEPHVRTLALALDAAMAQERGA